MGHNGAISFLMANRASDFRLCARIAQPNEFDRYESPHRQKVVIMFCAGHREPVSQTPSASTKAGKRHGAQQSERGTVLFDVFGHL